VTPSLGPPLGSINLEASSMAAGGFWLAAQNQKMTDFYQIANPPPVNPPSGSRRLCFVLSKESVVQSTHGMEACSKAPLPL